MALSKAFVQLPIPVPILRRRGRAGSLSERVLVDFNTMNQDLWSEERRVRVHPDDVKVHFQSGMHVVLADDTLEVEAILEYDHDRGIWWARPDWSTLIDLP